MGDRRFAYIVLELFIALHGTALLILDLFQDVFLFQDELLHLVDYVQNLLLAFSRVLAFLVNLFHFVFIVILDVNLRAQKFFRLRLFLSYRV